MAFNLFGALAVALAVVLVIYLLRRHFLPGLPGWLMPAAAGVAMVAFAIWNSYAWFDRVTGYLSDGVVVAASETTRSPIEPWTYVVPRVERFAAVDLEGLRRNPEHPDLVLADVWFFARFQDNTQHVFLFDCAAGRMAAPPAELNFDETGAPEGVDWAAASPTTEALVRTVCQRG